MSFFSKLIGGGVSGIVDSVSGVIDKFTLSKEEKQEFQLEMQSKLMQIETELEKSYRTELDSRKEIIKAEMAQGDLFTKRARPSIVYMGLIFILIIHVIIPVIAYFIGTEPEKMPDITLPDQFWWAWGTVVGIYGAGRSAEKMGITNKITNLATGSGAHSLFDKKVEG